MTPYPNINPLSGSTDTQMVSGEKGIEKTQLRHLKPIESEVKGFFLRLLGMAVKVDTKQGTAYVPTERARAWVKASSKGASTIEGMLITKLKTDILLTNQTVTNGLSNMKETAMKIGVWDKDGNCIAEDVKGSALKDNEVRSRLKSTNFNEKSVKEVLGNIDVLQQACAKSKGGLRTSHECLKLLVYLKQIPSFSKELQKSPELNTLYNNTILSLENKASLYLRNKRAEEAENLMRKELNIKNQLEPKLQTERKGLEQRQDIQRAQWDVVNTLRKIGALEYKDGTIRELRGAELQPHLEKAEFSKKEVIKVLKQIQLLNSNGVDQVNGTTFTIILDRLAKTPSFTNQINHDQDLKKLSNETRLQFYDLSNDFKNMLQLIDDIKFVLENLKEDNFSIRVDAYNFPIDVDTLQQLLAKEVRPALKDYLSFVANAKKASNVNTTFENMDKIQSKMIEKQAPASKFRLALRDVLKDTIRGIALQGTDAYNALNNEFNKAWPEKAGTTTNWSDVVKMALFSTYINRIEKGRMEAADLPQGYDQTLTPLQTSILQGALQPKEARDTQPAAPETEQTETQAQTPQPPPQSAKPTTQAQTPQSTPPKQGNIAKDKTEAKTPGEGELLDGIRKGVQLRKAQAKPKDTFNDYLEKTERGEIKYDQIPENYRKTLTPEQQLKLKIAEKQRETPEVDTSTEDEWT